jgi:hypothetical protein
VTRPEPGSPVEVFLSHADADRSYAQALSIELTRHGVAHWFSRRQLIGAQQWHDEIGSALARCDWFVLLLSARSTESMWVKRELLFALGERRYEGRIVPILLEDCDPTRLSWSLNQIQYVDFRTSTQAALRALLRVWGIGYKG